MSCGCQHVNFRAQVGVQRLTEREGSTVVAFSAEVRIQCVDCGEAFAFMGLPSGASLTQPTVCVGGEEVRLPIEPVSKAVLRASAIAGSA